MKNHIKNNGKLLFVALTTIIFTYTANAELRQTEPGKTRVPDNLAEQLQGESDNIKNSCAEFNKHVKYWEEKWPHHDIGQKNRGGNLLNACYSAINAQYARPGEQDVNNGNAKINEATKLTADAKIILQEAQAEHDATIEKAKKLENEGRELLRESNAIKGKGDRLYNDGEVDQGKSYLDEAKNRKEKGDTLIAQAQKLNSDAATKLTEKTKERDDLLAKAKNLTTEGDALKKRGEGLISKNNTLRNIVCPEGKCDTHDW